MDRRIFMACAAVGLLSNAARLTAQEKKSPVVGFLALLGVNTQRRMRDTVRELGTSRVGTSSSASGWRTAHLSDYLRSP